MLSSQSIKEAMSRSGIGGGAVFLDTCGSTNDVAKSLAAQGAPDMTCVVSNNQTGGKGRAGRGWVSCEGAGLYMTVILRHDLPANKAAVIPLAAAVAVCRAIDGLGLSAGIKWPNDIVIGGRKVCGILVEGGAGWAAVGIGINVAHQAGDLPADISATATSLHMRGLPVTRLEVFEQVMNCLKEERALLEPGKLSQIISSYRKLCVNIGSEVSVHSKSGDYRARAVDIAGDGALVIIPDGEIEPTSIYAGDVSVRGIMGYV